MSERWNNDGMPDDTGFLAASREDEWKRLLKERDDTISALRAERVKLVGALREEREGMRKNSR